MRPANPQQARRHMRHVLGKKITGRRRARVKEHTERALTIAEVLYRQFQVGPYQYNLRHLEWYLGTRTQALKPSSRYRHWLTVRLIVQALNQWEKWQAVLENHKPEISRRSNGAKNQTAP